MKSLSCLHFYSIILFVLCIVAKKSDTESIQVEVEEGEGFASLDLDPAVIPEPVPVPEPEPEPVALYLTETADRIYYVTVGIGSPAQFLRLLLHVGIGDIWIRQCLSYFRLECLTQTSYWPAHSSTASTTVYRQEYDLQFHPSTIVVGQLAIDNIQLGNKIIQDQSFAVFDRIYHTSTATTSFNDEEGFFGLGHPIGSLLTETLFIESMIEQKLLPKKTVSIYLRENGGGELMLGGDNPRHYRSKHIWADALNNEGGWEIELQDIYMRDVVHAHHCWATISTITSSIAGPPADIEAINDYLFPPSMKKPRKTSMSCANRVYAIMKESFNANHNDASAEEVCLSMEWCHRGHLDNHQTFAFRKLLEQDARDFEHHFGCAACMAIAEHAKNMAKLEDYDPEFGVSLCNWLSSTQPENSTQNDTDEVDCNAVQTSESLRIRTNGEYLYIEPRHYIYKRVHPNLEITCHTEFIPLESPEGEKWILGTSFLRAFHTIIDYEKSRIGFATPAGPIWVH